jgi:hypothetical protein
MNQSQDREFHSCIEIAKFPIQQRLEDSSYLLVRNNSRRAAPHANHRHLRSVLRKCMRQLNPCELKIRSKLEGYIHI